MIDKYDLEYMEVKCVGVSWNYETENVFYFMKDGIEYAFKQIEDVSCSSDTDHIRCVIEDQFLPWWTYNRIKELESENAELRSKLDKAMELKANVGDVNSYKKHHIIIAPIPIQKDICSDNLFFPQIEYYVKQLYGDEEVEQIIKERDEYKHRAEEAEARIAERFENGYIPKRRKKRLHYKQLTFYRDKRRQRQERSRKNIDRQRIHGKKRSNGRSRQA